jgi:hypothetical protein
VFTARSELYLLSMIQISSRLYSAKEVLNSRSHIKWFDVCHITGDSHNQIWLRPVTICVLRIAYIIKCYKFFIIITNGTVIPTRN